MSMVANNHVNNYKQCLALVGVSLDVELKCFIIKVLVFIVDNIH